MNENPLVQLTLAYPRPAERQLLADLLEIDPDLAGFTTLHAEGHGHGFARASVQEQVSGRAERALLLAVLPEDSARRLVEGLRMRLPSPEIAYWMSPIIEFGRIVE
ncbi:hypothetical protein N790_13970 [Arenimonas malthae CC-JY-1]|uniref:DUF3240 domain-containing protein n=1 Tax=Arenimonas malthae CC-JY-1 TaxID=1384054 RepID=A0A091BJ67_9GAMM|nr:DUF3240 family protein [Arenimonas malthae]KFN51811.1 hypothetical protein N790_13970 [Arenimonas malthae CC-JY-1]